MTSYLSAVLLVHAGPTLGAEQKHELVKDCTVLKRLMRIMLIRFFPAMVHDGFDFPREKWNS